MPSVTQPRTLPWRRSHRPDRSISDPRIVPGLGTSAAPGAPGRSPVTARTLLTAYRMRAVAADATGASAAVTIATVARFDLGQVGWYAAAPLVLPVLWVTVLALHRTYESRYLGAGTEEYQSILRGGLMLFTVIAVGSYIFLGDVSRAVVLFSVPATMALSLIARQVLRTVLHRRRVAGAGVQRTLLIGRADAAVEIVRLLQATPEQGLTPVGVCMPDTGTPAYGIPLLKNQLTGDRPGGPNGEPLIRIHGVPVVAAPERLIDAVDAVRADVVAVISHPHLSGHALRKLSWALEERDVELLVSPGIVEVAGPRLSIRPVAGLSLLHLERPSLGGFARVAKTLGDRVVASLVLLVASPMLLAIAAAIRLNSPGPALFSQVRVGVHGREFRIYKFRSMVVDAEDRLIDLRDTGGDRDAGNDVLFKMRADPRVTRVGAWLRRYSMDELPQLINVAKGEMSLVGPRPPLPAEVARYESDATRRLRVRPGMTGLWQVSGRSDLSWEESLRLDLRYVDNCSIALDLSIMWRTIRAVFQGSGAY
jgi:lipopolysaccharide/colanic/teichoic acid biosynthesis glycosyltransferase